MTTIKPAQLDISLHNTTWLLMQIARQYAFVINIPIIGLLFILKITIKLIQVVSYMQLHLSIILSSKVSLQKQNRFRFRAQLSREGLFLESVRITPHFAIQNALIWANKLCRLKGVLEFRAKSSIWMSSPSLIVLRARVSHKCHTINSSRLLLQLYSMLRFIVRTKSRRDLPCSIKSLFPLIRYLDL